MAFEINDEELRYKIINLLINEEIGDINKANIIGQLPHEIEHTLPLHIDEKYKQILTKFPWHNIEV